MRSSQAVRASDSQCRNPYSPGVRSQHPPTQWNLRRGRCSSVTIKTKQKHCYTFAGRYTRAPNQYRKNRGFSTYWNKTESWENAFRNFENVHYYRKEGFHFIMYMYSRWSGKVDSSETSACLHYTKKCRNAGNIGNVLLYKRGLVLHHVKQEIWKWMDCPESELIAIQREYFVMLTIWKCTDRVHSPNFWTFMEPRNRFQGINSVSLWSLSLYL